jgi:hypothetical protein
VTTTPAADVDLRLRPLERCAVILEELPDLFLAAINAGVRDPRVGLPFEARTGELDHPVPVAAVRRLINLADEAEVLVSHGPPG